MKCLFGSIISFAWFFACVATGLSEPARNTNTQQYEAAIQALNKGDHALSKRISRAILSKNPDNFLAQYLEAFALSEMGRHKAAVTAVKRAYRLANTDNERLLAARVAASAQFRNGHYTRAEWWLRRAANNINTPEEADIVSREFRAIRQKNPLSLRFGLSIAPSNNINGGTEERTFSLGEFDFIFGEDSRSLSGVEFSGDIELSYRLSQSAKQITHAGLYLFGRTYSLSSASQGVAPDISGNDYAVGLAEVSLSHKRLIFNGLGPTGVSAHFGQVWYGGGPLWRYKKLVLSQSFPIGQTAEATLQASVEDQTSLDITQPDTTVFSIRGTYAQRLENMGTLRFSLGLRMNDAAFETNTFTDHSATISYDLAKPVLGSRVSVSLGLGAKTYDEFSLSLDGRRDRYVSLGATAVMENVSYYGFSPSWTLSAVKTDSNVTRFSTLEITGRLGVQSNF
jgi:hypothetical protein